MTDALNLREEPSDLALSVQQLKEIFLFGVSLKDDDGNEMSPAMLEFHIRAAQSWLEKELHITLLPTDVVNEAHDYYLHDLMNNGTMRLFQRQVRSVSRYALQLPLSEQLIEFEPKWFRIDGRAGTIHLVPTAGTLNSFFSLQGAAGLLGYHGGDDYVPLSVYVDYAAGFEAGKVPKDLLEVIGMKAAMGPFNVAGDLISGAGIASKSIGLDGLTQSISTTSSATNAGYGARILQYNKEIESRMATLRTYYGGISMVVA